jgi:hypothetical protein
LIARPSSEEVQHGRQTRSQVLACRRARVSGQLAARRFVSKVTKELKKQATKAETAARFASDDIAANQLKALATAFRTQAKVIKKNRKKKSRHG